MKLYVPTSLARDELALGRQMGKRQTRRGRASPMRPPPRWSILSAARPATGAARIPRAWRAVAAGARPESTDVVYPARFRSGGGRLPQAEGGGAAADQHDRLCARRAWLRHHPLIPCAAHHYRATRPAADGSSRAAGDALCARRPLDPSETLPMPTTEVIFSI